MSRRATILAYHAIARCPRDQDHHNLFVAPETFEWQMRFLARRRHVVKLDDAMRGAFQGDRPAVVITFDDAYANLLQAVSILERHGFPATVFVPTGRLGEDAGWLRRSSCDTRVMTETDLRSLGRTGLALESHGHRHLHMASLTDDEARADVEASTGALERIAGARPRYFAYPFGEWSPSVAGIVRDCGYEAAFGIDHPGRDRYAYERTQITPFDGRGLFAAKTSGRYLAVRHAPVTRAAYGAVKPVVRRLLRR